MKGPDLSCDHLLYIFKFAEPRDVATSYSRVCRLWRQAAEAPSLWAHFAGMRNHQEKIPLTFLASKSKAIKTLFIKTNNEKLLDIPKVLRSFTNLEHVHLTGYGVLEDDIVLAVVQYNPQLQSLSLKGRTNLLYARIPLLSNHALTHIAMYAKNLKKLEIEVSNLKVSYDSIKEMAEVIKNLDVLTLHIETVVGLKMANWIKEQNPKLRLKISYFNWRNQKSTEIYKS